MAGLKGLDKQDITLDFGRGSEQKADAKRIPLGVLTVADNILFTKDKAVRRRYGMTQVGTTAKTLDRILPDTGNGIFGLVASSSTVTSTSQPVKIATAGVTDVTPPSGFLGITNKQFSARQISTGPQSARAASAVSGNFLFVAYTEQILTANEREIFLDVYEHATGRGVNTRIPLGETGSTLYPRFLRVIAVGTTVYVFFLRTVAGNTAIRYHTITNATTTPTVSAGTTLVASISATSPFDVYQDPSNNVVYAYVPVAAATDVTIVKSSSFGGTGSWSTTTTVTSGNVNAITIARPKQTGDTSYRVIVASNTLNIGMMSATVSAGVVTQTGMYSFGGGNSLVLGHLSAFYDHVAGYSYILVSQTANGWLSALYNTGTFAGASTLIETWQHCRLIAGIGGTSTSQAGYFLYENNDATYVGTFFGTKAALTTRLVSSLDSFSTTDRTMEPSPFVPNSTGTGGWWSFCTTDFGGETYASAQTPNINHVFYATLDADTLSATPTSYNDATYFTRGRVSYLAGGRYTPSGISAIPTIFSLTPSAVGTLTGLMSIKACFVTYDKNGRKIVGPFSEPMTVSPSANAKITALFVTPPIDEENYLTPFVLEIYATDPDDSTYYRVYSSNFYIGFSLDIISNSTLPSLTTGTIFEYTAGQAFENIPPPAPRWVATARMRLWCPSPLNDTDLYFSSEPLLGEDVRWNPAQLVRVPDSGGKITGVVEHNQRIVVFKEHAIFVLSGNGPSLNGQGSSYSVEQLSTSYGCESQAAFALTPQGILFKTSQNGFWLLGNDYGIQYIGRGVDSYKTATVLAACSVENQNQVRFLLAETPTQPANPTAAATGGVLCYDYAYGQWTRIVGSTQLTDMCVGNDGVVYYLYSAATSRVFKEDSATYTDVDTSGTATTYKIDQTLGWLNFADVDGFQRVYHLDLIGTYLSGSAATLKVDVYFDYDESTIGETHSLVIDSTNATKLWGRIFFTRQKCKAMKLRIAWAQDQQPEANVQDASLTAMNFRVGVKNTSAPANGGARRA